MAMVYFRVVDTASGAAANGIGVPKPLLLRFHARNSLSLIDSYAEPSSSSSLSTRFLQISSVCSSAVAAVKSPPVKSTTCRAACRSLLRRKRRRKQRRLSGDESNNVGGEGFSSGDGGDGPFGGDNGSFGGGGGGGGWNFNRSGDGHWDESSSSNWDPAFDFVYEVLSWIMLSNCLHYAIKRILRWAAGGIVVADAGKVLTKLARVTWCLLLNQNL